MNRKIFFGSLFIILTSSYFLITFQEEMRIKIDNDKSTFSVFENGKWITTGIEYNKLYNGTKLLKPINKTIDYYKNESIMIKRTTYYEKQILYDFYEFNPECSKENFPVSHKIVAINAKGLIFQYQVTKLLYNGESKTLKVNSMEFGKKMKVEWDNKFYSAKITSNGILTVRYMISEDYEEFNVKLYDPDTLTVNFSYPSTTNNSIAIGNIFVNLTSSGTNDHFAFMDFDRTLVLWTRMDYNNGTGAGSIFYDNSSYRYDGTIIGSGTATSTGKFGKAVNFSTSAARTINFTNKDEFDSNLSLRNLTFSIWINLSNSDAFSSVFSKYPTTGTQIGYYLITSSAPGEHYLTFGVTDNVLVSDFTINMSKYVEKWQHIAIALTKDEFKFYMNGTLINTTITSTLGDVSNPAELIIGYDGILNCIRGQLDEFMVFNRTLSSMEIQSLYNATNVNRTFNITTNKNYTIDGITADTSGNENKTSLTIIGTIDSTAPSVNFISQIPNDIDTFNIFNTNLTINYTISDASGINISSVKFHFKTNSSTSDYYIFTNGSVTNSSNFLILKTGFSNISDNWTFNILDNEVYPATYNFEEVIMEEIPHLNYNLNINSYYVKIRLFNMTNYKNYSIFEIYATNQTYNTGSLRIYYCNYSYTSGNPIVSNNCIDFYNLPSTAIFNHTHTAYSKHHTIPFPISSSGKIGNIYVSNTSYFLVRGTALGGWNITYITNISRPDTIQTTTNSGNTWSNFAGTIDAHIHQYDGSETFWYYVCASDIYENKNCSNTRYDLINFSGLKPSAPFVYYPTYGSYINFININYTAAQSPNGYAIAYYNISLVYVNETFHSIIKSNNSLNLSYYWNSSTVSDGEYMIRVEACDVLNQCSFGYSEIFIIGCEIPTYDNWNLSCSYNCSWGIPKNITKNITFYENGILNLSTIWNFTGSEQYVFIHTGCRFDIYKNGGFN